MPVLGWLLLLSFALGALLYRREGAFAPITITMWFWAAVLVAAMVSGLQLSSVTGRAGWIVGIGLLALAAPVFVRHRRAYPSDHLPAPAKVVALPKVIVCAVVLLALVVVGYISFRSRISGATGTSFGNLTAAQIRAAQNTSARGGGLAALCTAASPVLACLGVYAARTYSTLWYGLTAAAVVALLDSPARTSLLALGVSTTAFYLYHRRLFGAAQRSTLLPRGRAHGSSRYRRVWTVLLAVAAVAIMLYYFNSSGDATGKNAQIEAEYPFFNGPSWLIAPVLYLTGGISAFSAALSNGIDPVDHPSSIYLFARLAHITDQHVHVPNTINDYVSIPEPFNVYTGFGQLYFDWGIGGVIVLCALLGWLAISAHRRATRTASLPWIWLAALLANVLMSMQLEYRLFLLDVDFEALLGVAAFWWIQRSQPRGTQERSGAVRAVQRTEPALHEQRLVSVDDLSTKWQQALGLPRWAGAH